MKIYLGLIVAAALTLTACGGENKSAVSTSSDVAVSSASEQTISTASSASGVVEPVAVASPDCTTVIVSDDAMKFDIKEISIKSSCKQYTITLKHVGKMPVAAMGHNVVIAKTADKDAVLKDGAEVAIENNYVKPNDERVVAHTKLIGGGQEDSITFDTFKFNKGEAYEYFCSFPGHYAMMNGKIKFAD